MPRRTPLSQTLAATTAWITEAALAHPADLRAHVAQRLAIGPAAAARLIGRLVDAQWLVRDGSARRPRHRPGLLRQVVRRYPLAGLDEGHCWARDFAPVFGDAPPAALRNVQHVFGELLNNAIDHSGGTRVTVSVRQTPTQLQLLVSDDGCGLFERLQRDFGLDDAAGAMLELGKGKLSSAPERHSGRGLYFTARLAEVLDLHANAQAFQHRGWQPHRWHGVRGVATQGTSVFVALSTDAPKDLDAVLRQHSADGTGYGFERTVVPLKLLTGDGVALDSRAQARRVAARLERFRRAELDFDGIESIGHGFADELFRVFARRHPALELVPLHAAPRLLALVDSVVREA